MFSVWVRIVETVVLLPQMYSQLIVDRAFEVAEMALIVSGSVASEDMVFQLRLPGSFEVTKITRDWMEK